MVMASGRKGTAPKTGSRKPRLLLRVAEDPSSQRAQSHACGSPSSNDAQRRRYCCQAINTGRSPPKNNWSPPGPVVCAWRCKALVASCLMESPDGTIHAEEYVLLSRICLIGRRRTLMPRPMRSGAGDADDDGGDSVLGVNLPSPIPLFGARRPTR